MYWNNPTIEIQYPTDQDPIQQSFHNGRHCLFYNPAIAKDQIDAGQTLQQLCDWANRNIKNQGVDGFISDKQNYYDIANLVKLNMWVEDIRQQGVVKPMMLFVNKQGRYGINNGESRLRAIECIPEITTIFGFISTTVDRASQFSHLERVESFEQFASICQAVNGQQFLFTLTDPEAPYGIFWYEYNSQRTAAVTPGELYCVTALTNYLKTYPNMVFTPEWFNILKDWSTYAE
jgi:hypothetical protein